MVLKTPDALQTLIDYELSTADEEEIELVEELLKPYLKYGELVQIEVDTLTKTVSLKKW